LRIDDLKLQFYQSVMVYRSLSSYKTDRRSARS
jgi:hypothetical protein